MVTTKNLLIIFAVLLLLLTLLSAFGGSIHPVENFDYSRNPVTGGKSGVPPENVHMESYPAPPTISPASMPMTAGPSASDDLYESPVNYGIVENFANSTKINTSTLNNGLKLANTGITSIINNPRVAADKKNIANDIQTDINDAKTKTDSLQNFTQYPTATIETFVEPFENDNGLKALYASV